MRVPSTKWLLVLEEPTKVAFASFQQLKINLLLSTLLMILLVSTITTLFAFWFTRPIERISKGVKRIAEGDLHSKIDIQNNDEIGQLAKSVNEMAAEVLKRRIQLLDEKRRLDLVVSGMGMGLVLIDETFRIRWVNQTMTEWFSAGINMVGNKCNEVLRNKCGFCQECTMMAEKMINHNQKEMFSTHMDAQGRNRSFRHQVFRLNPEKDDSSFLEVIEDITEKKQMEAAVIQADKLAAIGLLASGIAHEINNPLGILSLYGEDLEDRLKEEDIEELIKTGEIQKYLDTIQKQVVRCKAITSNLLNFSRKPSTSYEVIDIHENIQETLMLLHHIIKKKNIQVQEDLRANHPTILGPTSEIQQVLLNVISNALDALSEGTGQLVIQTEQQNSEQIVVKIKDNGIGIPKESLAQVFDPFFTTKPVGKGTGLGLSVCYGILKQLGGDIRIESQVHKGTTVVIYFPTGKGGM